jgi:hypothetical protein
MKHWRKYKLVFFSMLGLMLFQLGAMAFWTHYAYQTHDLTGLFVTLIWIALYFVEIRVFISMVQAIERRYEDPIQP